MKIKTVVNGKIFDEGGFDVFSVSGDEKEVRVSVIAVNEDSGEIMKMRLTFSADEWTRITNTARETAEVNNERIWPS